MTDYIENMMKTARIKPCYQKRIECKDGYEIGHSCNNPPCISCDKAVFEDVYPVFTAEKQIYIIILIGQKYKFTTFSKIFSNNSVVYQCRIKQPTLYRIAEDSNFAQALARLTTELMNAGELDKERIKEILSV